MTRIARDLLRDWTPGQPGSVVVNGRVALRQRGAVLGRPSDHAGVRQAN